MRVDPLREHAMARIRQRLFDHRGCSTVLALLIAHTDLSAQNAAGATEFWLAPPDVSDLHNSPGGEPLYLMCSTTGTAAAITVDLPANGAFVPIVRNLPATASTRIDLTSFKTQLETRPTNTIANTGLHVMATAKVVCHYEVANNNNTDMWTLKGAEALGQEFYIPLHKHAPFNNEPSFGPPHQAFASFDIVATQNATQVSIYSPTPLDGHAALQQFSINLNRGQTYSAGWTGANWSLPSTHPSGAVVLADKPVAVSIKDDSNHNPSGGCYDLMGDQIVPVSLLGEDYIAVKGSLNNTGDESVVVIATRNNTQVFLDGADTPAATLFAGEYYRVDMDYLASSSNNAVYLHASKPVYAVHVSGFGCESGEAQLPPLYRGGSEQVDVVRGSAESFFLFIAVPSAAVNGFSVTGNGTASINPASFVPVPGTGGEWHAARIQFNTTQAPVDGPLRIRNSQGYFLLGTMNGGAATGTRYGYYTNFHANGGFAVTSTPSAVSVPEPGGTLSFTVEIANESPAPATLSTLVDDRHGDLDGQGNCLLPQIIAAGSSYVCSYLATVTGNAAQIIANTTTASGVQLDAPLIASAAGSVSISDVPPGATLLKTAAPMLVDVPGGMVTFTARIDNGSSAEALTLTSLIDDIHGDLAGQGSCTLPQTIAVGGFYQCSFTVFVAGDAGDIEVDTITAAVSDDEANAVSAHGSANVLIGFGIFGDGFE
jgi:IgGFc binding protein